MPLNIDFHTIRPHSGSQNRGFEELCFEIISDTLPRGTPPTRHGTPDGGVEFIYTLSDGASWGWQAKYLFVLGDGQFGQLDSSVRNALTNYPSLTRYTFCLPYNLPAGHVSGQTSAKEKWEQHCAKWQQWARDEGMKVDFGYIGESELLAALTQPAQVGRARYWFDATILTPEWFREAVSRAVADAGRSYSPELTVKLPISGVFDGLGRTQQFETRLRLGLREIRDRCRWWSATEELAKRNQDVSSALEDARSALQQLDQAIRDINLSRELPVDFGDITERCNRVIDSLVRVEDNAATQSEELRDSARSEREEPEAERRERRMWESCAWEMRRTTAAVHEFHDLIHSETARLVNTPALFLTGKPGMGKTHLLCDVAIDRCEAGLPTVVLLGKWFSNQEPWGQVLRELQLHCSVDEFLGALETAAELADARAIILIDAINEGEGLSTWPPHFASFIDRLAGHPRIGVAMSCRTSYVKAIVPEGFDESKLVRVQHHGFAGREYEAVRKFFDHYSLILPDFPLLVPEFQNPLFLRLMCEALHDTSVRTVPRGATSVTSLFESFLASANRRMSNPRRCDYPEADDLVAAGVRRLAQEMLDQTTSWLPFDRARTVLDQLLPQRGWQNSLLNGLLEEGVLFEELIYADGSEGSPTRAVFFAYQRLGDHLRGMALCEGIESVEDLGARCKNLAADLSSAYRNSGLLEALAVQLPERWGHELHEVLPNPSLEPVQDAFLESLIWRDVKAIRREKCVDYLNQIPSRGWGQDRTVLALLQIACIPEHPLNAELLHSTLSRLKLAQRDKWWSTFIHWNSDEEGLIARMVDWARSEDTSYCADDAALLCAITLTWFLTTSNRFVRDRATKALVSLLKTRLHLMVELLDRFKGVNDPYVAERLFAVAYGCSLLNQDKEEVGRLARAVYSQIFSAEDPPTHVLLRDYARGVIERALHLECMLDGIDFDRVRPPHRSRWPIRAPSQESLDERYLGNEEYWTFRWSLQSLGDFRRYIVERTVDDFFAPNQAAQVRLARKEARKRSRESWNTFVNALDAKQLNLLNKKGGWRRLEKVLSPEQNSAFIRAVRDREHAKSLRGPIPFSTDFAIRWIFSRVLRMGWTPEQFLDFDRTVSPQMSRTNHKNERIGKKYQWIGFHQLLAHLADHYLLRPWWNRGEPGLYQGPWQLSVRDIDPSQLLRMPSEQAKQAGWWMPVPVPVPEQATPEMRDRWIQTGDNLPSAADLIDLTDPVGHKWITLEGHYEWQEEPPPEEESFRTENCRLWYQVRGYLVKTTGLDEFARWTTQQNWMGRWMPESHDIRDAFIGEYPWHPASGEEQDEWTQGDQRTSLPVPVRVPAAWYHWSSGYDCSIDDSRGALVPTASLIKSLGAAWQGRGYRYATEDGQLTFWDPGAESSGPNALLVDPTKLSTLLDKEGLAIVWTILGEKQVLGPEVHRHGWLEIYGAASLRNGRVESLGLSSEFRQSA